MTTPGEDHNGIQEIHSCIKNTGVALGIAAQEVNAVEELAFELLRTKSTIVAKGLRTYVEENCKTVIPSLKQMGLLPTNGEEGAALGVDKSLLKSISSYKAITLASGKDKAKNKDKNGNDDKNSKRKLFVFGVEFVPLSSRLD